MKAVVVVNLDETIPKERVRSEYPQHMFLWRDKKEKIIMSQGFC